jgi:hypothetical protein
MIGMLRIYSNSFLENVTIEKLTPWAFPDKNNEPRPQGGALEAKFLNPKTRSRIKFGMTKRPEPNRHVMLNLFQHLVCLFSAFSKRIFHPRPEEGVFRCEFNKCWSGIVNVDNSKVELYN